MTSEVIMAKTKAMIDDLKTVCANYGLGNASSEYKIITEVFLYKFLNDKFLHEIRKVDDNLKNAENIEETLTNMDDDEYEFLLASLPPATAQLKKEHFISFLFNNKNREKFNELFDETLVDIANFNIDVFAVKTGSEDKIRLFDALSVFVTETNKRADFCRAIIDKLVAFSFEEAFSQKYDFFAAVFEYLIKDYNKDFGKYAEYYTPHSIASIIAKILVPEGIQNVNIYDPAAGSGTLVLALAHQIGEENCTIYTQDISQKSNEFLRLNLILNNLVHSLGNVVHGDTLLEPQHLNKQKNGLMKFDYIVSNPPYIRKDMIPTLMEEVRDHEPLIALDGGEDGLDFYRKITREATEHLYSGGMLFFEIGYDQGETVKLLMEEEGYEEVTVSQDLAGLDRVVYGTFNGRK